MPLEPNNRKSIFASISLARDCQIPAFCPHGGDLATP